ncbi:UdgX family uracil-DNA binding protein [Pseudonocardia sp. KRD-184]|uniref:UdgX family uracil-DNA binding protein n=1 Tax=Pseudonocardia oceani TaxID=2792013 RepID=A0ABS6UHV3_9PSEU|nr:UdgX family uracil-DNA binding protein [Pseudonocardia oceani]MBW0093089.1 UdgX family uracil-DNA binding protein [Pseudonocardia oceani]MBW0099886.1 UdgX family uracil-DNA binding protein [Pseudonocardia oceani]MBW0112549.1 UdgX family uracil-DNA binding protein [Pseudonocardia oceani]MBW0125681.1 UdgX family uracil-DNA binding protein [Pseudonocardia oceani]MBW0131814.1 UdgX family uracil-DNA binding protein [Pseudonocardia oceani]
MSDLDELREAAASCTACELYEPATQTVFGAGPPSAWLMLVGEQPGDREDLDGAPFVGPAGRLLDTALQRAGIDRTEVYVTNAVKHFRFEASGNRRLHKTPGVTHVRACRPWLDGELAAVGPAVVATLGATAGKALLGSAFRITAERGRPRPWEDRTLVPTTHPSAILRTPPEQRDEALDALVADLRVVAELRP